MRALVGIALPRFTALPTPSSRGPRLLVIALVALVACGSKSGPEPSEAKDLGATGYVIDAPRSWKVVEDMENWFSLEDGRGRSQAQIRLSDFPMAADVAELTRSLCDGQQDVVADKLDNGGLFASCVGPSRGIKMEGTVITTTKVEVQVPAGDGKSFSCAWETDQADKAKQVLAACKTIRKK